MHTLKHKQRHTHKQKGTCSYMKSILYHSRKNGIQKKTNIISRKTNATCCQSSIVSPGSSKTTPNILKVDPGYLRLKTTHTDQSETQPKSCSVHLFIKDSKNSITIFEVGGRGEAYKFN